MSQENGIFCSQCGKEMQFWKMKDGFYDGKWQDVEIKYICLECGNVKVIRENQKFMEVRV